MGVGLDTLYLCWKGKEQRYWVQAFHGDQRSPAVHLAYGKSLEDFLSISESWCNSQYNQRRRINRWNGKNCITRSIRIFLSLFFNVAHLNLTYFVYWGCDTENWVFLRLKGHSLVCSMSNVTQEEILVSVAEDALILNASSLWTSSFSLWFQSQTFMACVI